MLNDETEPYNPRYCHIANKWAENVKTQHYFTWCLLNFFPKVLHCSYSCTVSVGQLAFQLDVSPKTIQKHLKLLEKSNLITITEQYAENGTRLANLITLNVSSEFRNQLKKCPVIEFRRSGGAI